MTGLSAFAHPHKTLSGAVALIIRGAFRAEASSGTSPLYPPTDRIYKSSFLYVPTEQLGIKPYDIPSLKKLLSLILLPCFKTKTVT